ncbi:hypothetical protein G9464_10980 [Halostella sp. JP-L12]|uniref:hypothetical protein n=1 Tax=Halostella TaxID=1843185 RepID=UPI000EF7C188|nr:MULTISPECIES: hypothetical protein [Halostella]NHN48120.1 hypothetical protein [Halostella sp. JP-L12]
MLPLLSQWVVPFTALLATSITVYKFWIQRPSLIVDAEVAGAARTADGVALDLDLYVANVGRDFAEDGYVAVTASDWTLDATPVDGLSTTTCDDETTARDGEWKAFIDDIVYRDTGFKLYDGTATVPGDGRYRLSYTTACQSQRPRTGTLDVIVESGTATVRT